MKTIYRKIKLVIIKGIIFYFHNILKQDLIQLNTARKLRLGGCYKHNFMNRIGWYGLFAEMFIATVKNENDDTYKVEGIVIDNIGYIIIFIFPVVFLITSFLVAIVLTIELGFIAFVMSLAIFPIFYLVTLVERLLLWWSRIMRANEVEVLVALKTCFGVVQK